MPSKEELRNFLRSQLAVIVQSVNDALRGKGLQSLEPVLTRVGRGGKLPHWFRQLAKEKTLPNLDGKTVGSVIEMILVGVLETRIFNDVALPPFKINPARGIDLPSLDLGVKSPSTNYCTSEPFFSAYERLTGSDHDVLVLLTNYQEAKSRKDRFQLQIINASYLRKTEIADKGLCGIARKQRQWLLEQGDAQAQRVFRFLAYVTQSDWRAKKLLALVENLQDEEKIRGKVRDAHQDFTKINQKREKKDQLAIPDAELESLEKILKIKPLHIGINEAVENWVVETQKENARAPNANEWARLKSGPLDGKIGMSLALQWRYNFGPLFGKTGENRAGEERS